MNKAAKLAMVIVIPAVLIVVWFASMMMRSPYPVTGSVLTPLFFGLFLFFAVIPLSLGFLTYFLTRRSLKWAIIMGLVSYIIPVVLLFALAAAWGDAFVI